MTEAAKSRPVHPVDRFLLGFGRKLLLGFGADGRLKRYAVLAIPGLAAIWALAIAYVTLAPVAYTSQFTLILPGSGAGASVNLAEIGQASTMTASPFSQASLSPTESYKRIMTSRPVIEDASARVGLKPYEFPNPIIKLVDQTQLMIVRINGGSPEAAQANAEALQAAFLDQLEILRRSEGAAREEAYREYVDGFREAVSRTRRATLEAQTDSDLVSIDQFETILAGLEILRGERLDQSVEASSLEGQIAELSALVDLTPQAAMNAFLLRADAEARALLGALADQEAEFAALAQRLGPNHPERARAERSLAATHAALAGRGAELTGVAPAELRRLLDLSAGEERGAMMERLVVAAADLRAVRARIAALDEKIAETNARVRALTPVAAALDDLQRDHQVAEAVFSSALARIDTTKTDFFASYPLVQTLETADRPAYPSEPMRVLAIAGAVLASLFWIMGLMLLWIRLPVLRVILKTL